MPKPQKPINQQADTMSDGELGISIRFISHWNIEDSKRITDTDIELYRHFMAVVLAKRQIH